MEELAVGRHGDRAGEVLLLGTAAAIRAWVGAKLGDRPYQRKVTDLVLGLRKKPPR